MTPRPDAAGAARGRAVPLARRALSFLLDWMAWGYVAYCVMYLLNHYWYTVHVDWWGTLTLPSWGWPLVVLATLELAVWCRSLGRSLGQRAIGIALEDRAGGRITAGRRLGRILLWHVSVPLFAVGFWRGGDPWHDRIAKVSLRPVSPDPERPGRRAFATQWGIVAPFLGVLTLWVGWLIIGINFQVLAGRAAQTGRIWGEMLRPDFRYFTAPDPVFALRAQSYSILDLAVVTVFMALTATILGGVIAFPLSFLGARNVMGFGPAGWATYGIVRGFFNVFRSIETIIWGSIFAVWVGYGTTLAGILALTVHTIAALGKLYSEQVEGVSPGPLEAVWAAGGSRVQVVRHAVIPQVLPSFWAFTLYRWDINVRMSTVIALVGGGGIGDMLFYYKNQGDWPKVGAVVMVIVAIVWAMDYISGRLRERIA
ncbi:MAG TPA: phosphonate ABC transporter, permease protein PhnE [Candidatus Acetothermia bacterium]|nr:phosphonate ABC transporter, permease protein PhnE [Candidatus Acetothermia bacterium]